MARRLIAHGVRKGDRVALIAETGPEFAALFCGCVYAGAWPVPLPLPTSFGGKEAYIDQLAVQLASRSEDAALSGRAAEMAQGCGRAAGLRRDDLGRFRPAGPPEADLPEAKPDDICYLQYSSGSTRFPHGVAVTHEALLNNLAGHMPTA
jgi:fatty-acyl-CoA synthase